MLCDTKKIAQAIFKPNNQQGLRAETSRAYIFILMETSPTRAHHPERSGSISSPVELLRGGPKIPTHPDYIPTSKYIPMWREESHQGDCPKLSLIPNSPGNEIALFACG